MDVDRTPTPDPRLAAALRGLAPEASPEEVDWERLRAAIAEGAALPLARRRRAARLRRAVRWAGLATLVAAAALLALYLGGLSPLGDHVAINETPAADSGAAPGVLVEEVVRASLPAGELEELISGRAEQEALLYAAVGQAERVDL